MRANSLSAKTTFVVSGFSSFALVTTAILSTLSNHAHATPVVFFDTGGFENPNTTSYPWNYISTPGNNGLPRHVPPHSAPTSVPGNLQWVAQYQTPTTALFDNETDGTAVIQTNAYRNGSQALQVDRTPNATGTQRYFYAQPTMDVLGANLTQVTVSFSMRVMAPVDDPSTFPSGSSPIDYAGPFFGIETKGFLTSDTTFGTPYRIGNLGVNSRTKEVVVIGRATPTGPIEQFAIGDSNFVPYTVDYGVNMGPAPYTDAWYTFQMIIDYQNKTFDVGFEVSPNNVQIIQTGVHWAEAGDPSVVNGITRFGDADITGSALFNAVLNTTPPSGGTAYFDDLIVTAVPEPSTLALMAGVAFVTLRRRTR